VAESLVVTEAPTRWVHESTSERCNVAGGFSSEAPGYGRCYAHHERIRRVIDPGNLLDTLQDVADAAEGDSNDKEIELLQDALDGALSLLGVKMPEARDRCDVCDEPYDKDDPHAGYDMCASCLHNARRSGWSPGD
jgi:hypothetical protein